MNTGKFCKICCDTGKSASEYKSHNIRDRGVVVCPVLKETVCKYCKTKGHMMSHCVALKEKKRIQTIDHRNDISKLAPATLAPATLAPATLAPAKLAPATLAPAKRKASMPSNTFDALLLDSEDEASDDEIEPETKSWVGVAASCGDANAKSGTQSLMYRVKKYTSWADYSSDSSDDETL